MELDHKRGISDLQHPLAAAVAAVAATWTKCNTVVWKMKKTKMDLASAIAMYIDAYMPSILQALFGILEA